MIRLFIVEVKLKIQFIRVSYFDFNDIVSKAKVVYVELSISTEEEMLNELMFSERTILFSPIR
jgi:hypothetical protein